MEKSKALKLIGDLSKSAIRGWELTNSRARGSVDKAIAAELSAAKQIIVGLGVEATEAEIEEALNS